MPAASLWRLIGGQSSFNDLRLSSQAIAKVNRAFGDNELPMLYLPGKKRCITSLGKIVESDNAKLVLLPADIQSTLRGLFQRVTKTDN